jgi:hypothetical protein
MIDEDDQPVPELGNKRHGVPPEGADGSDGIREQGRRY